MEAHTSPSESYRENLSNPYEMQEIHLLDIQAGHEAELYATGIASRALDNLPTNERDRVLDTHYANLQLAVYGKVLEYGDDRENTYEYGVRFSIKKLGALTLKPRRSRNYNAPVATIFAGDVVAYGENQGKEAQHDARAVYSMVYELLAAQAEGVLPDLSLDLTSIKDGSKDQPPTPLI